MGNKAGFKIFSEMDLNNVLQSKLVEMKKEIDEKPDNSILYVNSLEIINSLVGKYTCENLTIRFNEVKASSYEKSILGQKFPPIFHVIEGRSYKKDVYKYSVPFSGDELLLHCVTSQRILWETEVSIEDNCIVFEIINFSNDIQKIQQAVKVIIGAITTEMNNVVNQVKSYNTSLESYAQELIQNRKQDLLKIYASVAVAAVPSKKRISVSADSKLIRRVFLDLKKYWHFIQFSIICELKINVVGTYLGVLWWFLEPLLSMLVYVFYVNVIFNRGNGSFPLYVFCATLAWAWIMASINKSTTLIINKRRMLQEKYIPKFILPLISTITDGFYFLVGAPLLVIVGVFFSIYPSIHLIEFFVVVFFQFFFIYACSMVFCHIGVYFRDIGHILTFALRMLFYLSPGMYQLDWAPEKFRWVWWLNPLTTYFTSYRNVFMFAKSPEYLALLGWFGVSVVMIIVMLKVIYKFDKNYTKVI